VALTRKAQSAGDPDAPSRAGYEPAGRERVGLAARTVAAALISKVVDGGHSLDQLCDEKAGLASLRALIAKDRALARAIALTALRRRRQIERAISSLVRSEPPKAARHLLHTLHVAAAQVLFMQVPPSAAVNLAVTALAEDRRSSRFTGFANALLRRLAENAAAWRDAPVDAASQFPAWLATAIAADHGSAAADAIAAMVAREPMLDLTLAPDMDEAERAALATATGGRLLSDRSLRIFDGRPVREIPGYADGRWWVQDHAASLPARLLGDVAGLRVADLCAAPGGKTAQLAAAGARVTAVDVSAPRLERLRANLERLRLKAEAIAADFVTVSAPQAFDAVLLDVPCSSTGTLRRHPDVMWAKSAEDIDRLAAVQARMLLAASRWVKPGGRLVYANCSLLKREGEEVVARALKLDPSLSIRPVARGEAGIAGDWIAADGALRTLPCHLPLDPPERGGLDGFYACRLVKAA